jgi:hypothetical protein
VPTPLDFLIGVALPALLAGLLLLCARRAAWGPGAGAALAVGGGCVAAQMLQRGWRGWPPTEATDWLWVCAAVGGLVGAAGLTRRGPEPLRLAWRLLACGAVAWIVLSAWRRSAEASTMRAVLAAIAAGGALVWSLLERARPEPSWQLPAVLALTAAASAVAMGVTGSVALAMLGGASCGLLSACAVARALRLAPPTLPGVVAPFVLAQTSLLLVAVFYSYLPVASAGMIAAAPCAALLPRALGGERAARPRAALLPLLACVALLVFAVKLAFDASPSFDGLDG